MIIVGMYGVVGGTYVTYGFSEIMRVIVIPNGRFRKCAIVYWCFMFGHRIVVVF